MFLHNEGQVMHLGQEYTRNHITPLSMHMMFLCFGHIFWHTDVRIINVQIRSVFFQAHGSFTFGARKKARRNHPLSSYQSGNVLWRGWDFRNFRLRQGGSFSRGMFWFMRILIIEYPGYFCCCCCCFLIFLCESEARVSEFQSQL